ncbi:hypothetical protein JCM16358_18090 [Halanaerocella petrolearia]
MKRYIAFFLVGFLLILGNPVNANDLSAISLIEDVRDKLQQVEDFKGTVVTKVKVDDQELKSATQIMKSKTRFMTKNLTSTQHSIAETSRMLNTIPWLYLPPDYSTIMEVLPLEGQLDYQQPLQVLEKLYQLELLGEAIYNNRSVYIIELSNLFSTQRFYIDRERKLITEIKVFNSSNIKVADISYTNFKKFDTKVWLPTKVKVETSLNKESLQISFQDWKVNLGLTSFDFAQGFQSNYQTKVNKLKQKLKKTPQNDKLYWQISQIYQQNSQLNKAVSNIRKAIRINDQIKYRKKLVELLRTQGMYQEALGEVRTALQLDYNNPELNYLLGELKLQLGNTDQGRYYLEKAVNYAPKNTTYLEKLFWVYYNSVQESDRYMLERAEKIIKKLVKLDSDNKDYQIYLGDLYFDQGELIKAAKAYNKAIALAPEDTWGYIKLANFYKQTGRYDKAEELYRYVIYLDDSLQNHRRLAKLYFDLKKYKLALEEYQVINNRSAGNIDLKFKLIESYLATGKQREGMKLAKDMLQKEQSGKLYLKLAEMVERYDLGLAIEVYQLALETESVLTTQQQDRVYSSLNRIFYNRERSWELEQLKEIVPLQSQAMIYQLLGKYQLANGNFKSAISNFKLATKINNNRTNHYNLALSYLLADKFEAVKEEAKILNSLGAIEKANQLLRLKNKLTKLKKKYQKVYVPGRINYLKANKLRQQGKLDEALVKYQAALFENYDYQLPRFYIVLLQALQGNDFEVKLAKSGLRGELLQLAEDMISILKQSNKGVN